MLYAELKLWPYGEQDDEEAIGSIKIINTGTGTSSRGNYEAEIYDERGKLKRKSEVHCFPRFLGAWELMATAISRSVAVEDLEDE